MGRRTAYVCSPASDVCSPAGDGTGAARAHSDNSTGGDYNSADESNRAANTDHHQGSGSDHDSTLPNTNTADPTSDNSSAGSARQYGTRESTDAGAK